MCNLWTSSEKCAVYSLPSPKNISKSSWTIIEARQRDCVIRLVVPAVSPSPAALLEVPVRA